MKNDFTGNATNVAQIRDVHGDIHFHAASQPAVGQVVVGPVPRRPWHFQDRAQIARLSGMTGVAVLCAVTGQRGVGKTQVAGAYARQRIADGWLVAWIPAETPDSLTAGLLELADALGLRQEKNDPTTLSRLRSHLQTMTEPALLVFDNVIDPDVVLPHLPATGSAQIVLTSAFRGVERIGEPVPVDLFTAEAAVRFLTETTGLDDEPGAHALAEELGRLPLALAQAAARITTVERDYATYLRRLNELPVKRHLRAHQGDPYPRGAAEAVLLAVEPFDNPESALERELLELLAVLSPDGVPRCLLATGRDQAEVDDALERLLDASLIELVGGGAVSMHRLTQRILRDRMENLPKLTAEAIELLGANTFPKECAWELRERGDDLARQFEALWAHAPRSVALLELRAWGVRQLIESASANRAVHVARKVLADSHDLVGPEHELSRISAFDLAAAYADAGLLNDSITLYVQMLADCQRLLGDTHQDTLVTANSLGHGYQLAGRFGDAIPLLERTLASCRKSGSDHRLILSVSNNLAVAYENTGRLKQAIPLYAETLAARSRLYGPDHQRTLESAHNLAHAYLTAGRLDDAIQLYEQTVDNYRRTLGNDHVDTITTLDHLATAYAATGRTDDALSILERNLTNIGELLGQDHPRTILTGAHLAQAYLSAERLVDSIPLHERVRTALLASGNTHPDAIHVSVNLAEAYRLDGRLADCLRLLEETHAAAARTFTDDHPQVLDVGCKLAIAYGGAGRLTDAIALLEPILTAAQRVLDDDHPLRITITHAYRALVEGASP